MLLSMFFLSFCPFQFFSISRQKGGTKNGSRIYSNRGDARRSNLFLCVFVPTIAIRRPWLGLGRGGMERREEARLARRDGRRSAVLRHQLLLLGKQHLDSLGFPIRLGVDGFHDTLLISREVADEALVELRLFPFEF